MFLYCYSVLKETSVEVYTVIINNQNKNDFAKNNQLNVQYPGLNIETLPKLLISPDTCLNT